MAVRIQHRRDAAERWEAANPILQDGELGVVSGLWKYKVGDGISSWNDLPYASGEKGDQGDQGIQGPKGDTGEQGLQGIQGPKGDIETPLTHDIDFAFYKASKVHLEGYRETVASTSGSGSHTLDLAEANFFSRTLTGESTLGLTGAVAGQACHASLILHQGEEAHAITWNSSIKWRGGTAPALDETNTKYELTFCSIDGGVTWLAKEVGEY